MSVKVRVAGFLLLAGVLFWKVPILGYTYYPADILYSYPLWYDGVHHTHNYDLFDVINLFYPHDLLFHQQLHQGRLFLWNPYNFCGQPIFADGQSPMLYPPRVLLNLLLSTHRAHDLYLWLHVALMGIAAYFLLRRLGVGDFGATVAGVVWMFNGFSMGWLEHGAAVTFAAWLPVALLLITDGFAPRRRRSSLVWASIVLGMLGYAGHMQFWAYCLLLAGAWTVYRCWRGRLADWAWGAAFLALVLPLAALQLVPMFHLLGRCERPTMPLDFQMQAYRQLLAGLLPSLAVPDIFGNPASGFALRRIAVGGYWIYPETCAYVGVFTLFLVPLGFWRSSRDANWRFFLGGLIALLVVPATPLYAVPYYLFPGFSKIVATRLLFLVTFCLAVLAGYGAEALLQRPAVLRRLAAAGLAFALVWGLSLGALQLTLHSRSQLRTKILAGVIAGGWIRLPDREVFNSTTAFVHAAVAKMTSFYSLANPSMTWPLLLLIASAAWLWLWARGRLSARALRRGVLLLLAVDLLFYAIRFNTAVPVKELYPETPVTAFLQSQPRPFRVIGLRSLRPNCLMPYHIETVGGQDSLYPKTTAMFMNALQTGRNTDLLRPFVQDTFPITNVTSPLVNLAGARYVVTYPQAKLSSARFRLVFKAGMKVYRNTQAMPRLWIVPRAEPVDSFRQALEQVNRAGVNYRATVFIQGAVGRAQTAPPSPHARIEILRMHPGLMRVRYRASGGGWLIYDEAWGPGWKATVNGQPATPRIADALFMAVPVPPGRGTVAFRYRPDSLWQGLWISLAGLLAVLVLAGVALKNKPRTGNSGE